MATPYQERKIPAPALNAENKPFFDAAARGVLLVKYCAACGEYHHYPRAICPHCFSDRTEWREAKGTGTIYTWSVLRRGVPVPYCLAYVTLDEGVSMITNIVDCDLDTIRIGQKVRVVFKPTEGGPPVPMFGPGVSGRSAMDTPRPPPIPRPAATIVVLREADRGIEVLLVRRTRAVEFAGGAHVFPGGAVDPADSDAVLVAACAGLDDPQASRHLGVPQGGLAYWICAMRECFEEAGLLYAYAGEELTRFDSPARDAGTFDAIVTSRGLKLAADRLAYLSHWITQAGRPRRYDTRFFVAAAPEHQQSMHDGSEAVDHDWLAPRVALERHAQGAIHLLFPTIKTLELLGRFGRVADALEYARSPRPMPPMAPRSAVGRAGPKLLVPGDYAYAEIGKLDPDGAGTASYEIVPGTVVQIAPRIRRLTAPNPGAMTGPGTNTYLLGDAASGIAVIDPGPMVESHIDGIVAAAGGRIEWILCTHSHVDHSPAAAPLKERTGAKVLGMRARHPERQDPTFAPDRELVHGERLEVAGFTVRVLHTPGHASNQLCFLEEGGRLLFTGDHLMQGSTVVINPPDGDMATYLASLRMLLDEPLDYIAPGHGFLMARPHEMVERVLIHRRERENKVLAQLAEHGPATLEALLPHVYEDVPLRMHPVASRSLLAHLLKLRDEGRAAEAAGAWRVEPG